MIMKSYKSGSKFFHPNFIVILTIAIIIGHIPASIGASSYTTYCSELISNSPNGVSQRDRTKSSPGRQTNPQPNPCFSDLQTNQVIVEQGSRALLPCVVENLPATRNVNWFKSGVHAPVTLGTIVVLNFNNRVSLLQQGNQWNLVIDKTELADEANYTCTVPPLFHTGSSLERQVALKVKPTERQGIIVTNEEVQDQNAATEPEGDFEIRPEDLPSDNDGALDRESSAERTSSKGHPKAEEIKDGATGAMFDASETESRSDESKVGHIPENSTMYLVCTASWPLPPPIPLASSRGKDGGMGMGMGAGANQSAAAGSYSFRGTGPGSSSHQQLPLDVPLPREVEFLWFLVSPPSSRTVRANGGPSIMPPNSIMVPLKHNKTVKFPSGDRMWVLITQSEEPLTNRFKSTLEVRKATGVMSGTYFCKVRVKFVDHQEIIAESGRMFVKIVPKEQLPAGYFYSGPPVAGQLQAANRADSISLPIAKLFSSLQSKTFIYKLLTSHSLLLLLFLLLVPHAALSYILCFA